jgi:PAS domain S-box-containing protein
VDLLILDEATLAGSGRTAELLEALQAQPSWSDVPILLVADPQSERAERGRSIERCGNVLLLERPLRMRALRSAIHTALRGRRRQYELRDQIAAAHRDASSARRVEHALRESELRLRVTQEAAHSGVFDHDFTTGRTHWSSELAALYGGSGSGPPAANLHGWMEHVHPEDRERVLNAARRALEHGDFSLDFRVVWPDGSIHWLESRAGVVFDDDGRPLRLLGVQLDVTEAKRAEQSRALLAAIVESSDDAMITKSPDGVITSWNAGAERVFGYAAGEVIGRPMNVLIPEDRVSEETEILRRVRSGQRVHHYETVRVTKDGRSIDISLTVSPVRDGRGDIIGVSNVSRDVTERKAMDRMLRASEAALREADRRKDEFLAMLAHELRNPLAPIRNAIGLLDTHPPSAVALDQIHQILDRQVAHLNRLVDDLLDVSRSSRGLIQTTKEPLALAPLFEMAVETARPLIQLRHHALVVRVPDEPIGLLGDRVRLVQVIANLLGNAAKFTPPGGHVTLEAVREGSEVTISVRDDGVGIAPEALPRIFDLFVQEEPSLARTQGGLGIGLTLVRDLVALHGGRVEARSDGRGRGAEFRVSLPVHEIATAPRATVERKPAPRRLRVLIAEDHRDTADSLRMLLERHGHEVAVARDGVEAVRSFDEAEPDVALVDIGLPGLDGYEVARRIRAGAHGGRAVLIAVSGYGREDDKRAARAAGFDHHMTKPVELARLVRLFPVRASEAEAADR